VIPMNGTGSIPKIPILLYHGITDGDRSRDRYRTGVPAGIFERQMRYLHERGYRCVSLEDLFRKTAEEVHPAGKSFALTFDDGKKDFYHRAFPVLKRFGFTATVFLVTDLVGERSRWDGTDEDPLMTWEQILALQQDGVTFGSHTCSHRRLTGISIAEVRRELLRSRETLEEKLKRKVDFLAYPYGDSNDGIRSMAKEAGYMGACGVLEGKPSRFNLPRREIHSVDTLLTFWMKLTFLHRAPNRMRRKTALGRMLDRLATRPARRAANLSDRPSRSDVGLDSAET
jgi:peptidoglycan/xylan/chitin deacetylase (PgdA/CDA1 family)